MKSLKRIRVKETQIRLVNTKETGRKEKGRNRMDRTGLADIDIEHAKYPGIMAVTKRKTTHLHVGESNGSSYRVQITKYLQNKVTSTHTKYQYRVVHMQI